MSIDELNKIKYGLDGDLFSTLMNQIINKDQEIISLKMIIEDLKDRLTPINSVSRDPDYISIDHASNNLRLASNLCLEQEGVSLHIIGRVFATDKHPHQSYSYFISENHFHHADLHTKEMILINMHKQLIHEVIKEYKKREKS